MKKRALVFGAGGYVGTRFCQMVAREHPEWEWYGVDLASVPKTFPSEVTYLQADITKPLKDQGLPDTVDWMINFAAVCREPGYETHEYYDVNYRGAEQVCRYAREACCGNQFFASSMAVYGPMEDPADESFPPSPISAYGNSKLLGEEIYRRWLHEKDDRKLVICRPAVVYGPGDNQNIFRMIQAVRKGYFMIPGHRKVHKSYAYLDGLMRSVFFTGIDLADREILYNYAEKETLSLEELAHSIRREFGVKRPLFRLPVGPLMILAKTISFFLGNRTPIHPVRVKKLVTSTYLVPRFLMERGFSFPWDFPSSLKDWREHHPHDFS